ncbi:MAG: glycosyltransferase family 1 protein [Planctomycetia bacterium]|nr:glycosyltransferase family 1 protein [Planctomycetia bacterium]
MSRQYFDITDLVRFARTNRNVSGIQRVQIRVIRHLAATPGGDDVFCLFAVSRFAPPVVCRAGELFGNEEYDAGRFLAALGLERTEDGFSERELYDYLARFPKRSLLRVVKKVEAILLRRVWPAAARRRLGLLAAAEQGSPAPARVHTWRVRRLETDDTLILLGTNWNVATIERLAKRFFRRGGEVVQVVYDLIPYRHPEYCIDSLSRKFNRFLVTSTAFTSRYICISEATRRDMAAFLAEHGSAARTATWPLAHEFVGYGRNTRGAVATNPAVAALADRPFVLCVGTIEVRKNGIGLLRAWQQLLGRLGDEIPLLVFAGKYGWKIDDFRALLAADEKLAAGVRVIDRASDADLAFLYQHCLFHAYPSLAEGWGLPVGEAAWFGKYSVVSSRSSLPEVCGPLIDYVDPENVDKLAAALETVIRKPDLRRQKEAAIAAAPLRTWADTAAHFGSLIARKTAL